MTFFVQRLYLKHKYKIRPIWDCHNKMTCKDIIPTRLEYK